MAKITDDNLMCIPEYKAGKLVLSQVSEATKTIREMINDNTDFVTKASSRMDEELLVARKNLASVKSQLVSEEMHGKSTVETAQKLKDAFNEVERIESTLDAISQSGGIAIIKTKEKVRNLKNRKYEAEIKLHAHKQIVPHRDGMSWEEKASMLSLVESEVAKLTEDISSHKNILDILGRNQQRFGKLLTADAETLEEAEKSLQIAVNAYKTLDKLRGDLVEKKRRNKEEVERLKVEQYDLEQAIEELDSGRTFDILWSSEVFLVLWPELFTIDDPRLWGNIKNAGKIKYHEIVRKSEAI